MTSHSIPSVERRICAGDWVRVIGAEASIRGLGKVIDADYDAADGALRLARIEFAQGVHWFWSGDIRRIRADEELRLCEGALAVAHMPEPARDRVRAALTSPPRSPSARSLGLLDLLWSLMGTLPGERAVIGLARFFDEGGHGPPPPPPPPPIIVTPSRATPRQVAPEAPAPYDPIDASPAPAPPPTPRPAIPAAPAKRLPPLAEQKFGSVAVIVVSLTTV